MLRIHSTIKAKPGARHSAKVYRDSEWGEYRVKFYRDAVHLGESHDYHTDDEFDALDTAVSIIDKLDA